MGAQSAYARDSLPTSGQGPGIKAGASAWNVITAHPGQSRLVKTPAINLLSFSLFLLRFAEQP